MTTTTHRLIDEYLHRLDRAARVLPRRDRAELLAEIRSHLDAGLPPQATEADIRNLLDELGPPDSIVAAARPDRRASRRGLRELFALLLLVLGLPPVVGWLAGVGLLLSSPLWSIRQKLLGILVWPGGYGFCSAWVSSVARHPARCPPTPRPAASSPGRRCGRSSPSSASPPRHWSSRPTCTGPPAGQRNQPRILW
jgi:hypothetical protein